MIKNPKDFKGLKSSLHMINTKKTGEFSSRIKYEKPNYTDNLNESGILFFNNLHLRMKHSFEISWFDDPTTHT